jgi:hypothetical protein
MRGAAGCHQIKPAHGRMMGRNGREEPDRTGPKARCAAPGRRGSGAGVRAVRVESLGNGECGEGRKKGDAVQRRERRIRKVR